APPPARPPPRPGPGGARGACRGGAAGAGPPARHTVGLADPLTVADVTPGERLDDGLPQSLQACVREYGLRHLKVKLSGDVGRDRDRLGRVAAVLGSPAPADFRFSVDGNEQFGSLAQFQEDSPAPPDGQAIA